MPSEISDHREMFMGNEMLFKTLSYASHLYRLENLTKWSREISYWGSRVSYWQLEVCHQKPDVAALIEQQFQDCIAKIEEQWKGSVSDLRSEFELRVTVDKITMANYAALIHEWRMTYENQYGAPQISAACGPRRQGRHTVRNKFNDWRPNLLKSGLRSCLTWIISQ